MKEGWQAEKHYAQRVYHYVVGTFSLCGKLGFYTGELIPDNPAKRTREDCRACIKKLNTRTRIKQ
jgi:hypothetical protein